MNENNISQEQANDELAAMLGEEAPTSVNPVETQPTNTGAELSLQGQAKLFAQIDRVVANLYEELATVDQTFKHVSEQFMAMAESYAIQAESNKSEQDEDLSDDDKAALAYAVTALAFKGLGNMVNAIKKESQFQKILPVLQKEAEKKGEFFSQQIEELAKIDDANWELLTQSLQYNYHFQGEELTNV